MSTIYKYVWYHIDTNTKGVKEIECQSRQDFLEKLNRYNYLSTIVSDKPRWIYYEDHYVKSET